LLDKKIAKFEISSFVANLLSGISFLIFFIPLVPRIFFVKSVATNPGLILLTWILYLAKSNDIDFVKPFNPDFVAEYTLLFSLLTTSKID